MSSSECPFCGQQLKKPGEDHDCKGTEPGRGDRLDERVEQLGPPEPRQDDGPPAAA